MQSLETAANKWLKPYPNAAWRENIEVLLVAIAVAMAIRTFFIQPFKIPTGSMQPTLFGITQENLIGRDDVVIPNPLAGFFTFWSATFFGIFSPVLGLGLISIGGAFVPIGFVLRRRLLRKMAAMSRIKRP